MPYIKSHSNYVLKKKHQLTNSGTIYERDITTIGGKNSFASNQTPIYQTGNFIITVNNDDNVKKDSHSVNWEEHFSGDVWTLSTLQDYIKDETSSEDESIVIKRDYYNLRDFAYFGSCSELIRASINDIINKFPGELFIPFDNTTVSSYTYVEDVWDLDKNGNPFSTPKTLSGETTDAEEIISRNGSVTATTVVGGIPVFYTDNSEFNSGTNGALNDDDNGNSKTKIKRLGGDNYFLVDNPFNVNIHTAFKKSSEITDDNFLKFFANEGYKNYELIGNNGESHKFNWVVKNHLDKLCVGEKICDVEITCVDSSETFVIEAWVSNNKEIKYLIDLSKYDNLIENGAFKYSIRPKVQFLDEFFKNLDMFERILMNKDSSPKYTAYFNILRENEYGYYSNIESFTFPTTYGSYNIGADGVSFDAYIQNLVDIANFYDERFCDNMYRSMTHESIKNFDWTYRKLKTQEESEDIISAGDKISKIIRLFGREFDEILSYINAIASYRTITYDDINNLPDYFFTDALENNGWDFKQITPYTLVEYTGASKTDISDKTTEDDEKSNTYNGNVLKRLFTQDTSFLVKPYDKKLDIYPDGYFFGCTPNHQETSEQFTLDVNNQSCESAQTIVFNYEEQETDIPVESYSREFENGRETCGYGKFTNTGGTVFSASTESSELDSGSTIDYPKNEITSYGGENITGDTFISPCNNNILERIKNYSSEKEWSMPEVNVEFEKRLILNSKEIWKHKGTQDSVEMILGMFGMRSKRWYDALPLYEKESYISSNGGVGNYNRYDFEIKEYTSFTTRIEDPYVNGILDYKYNWVNKAKNISYSVYGNDDYEDYQGLPVMYRDIDGKRYLYPNFDKNKVYDGNPYYQMNGGWTSTYPYMFDKDNNIVTKPNDSKIYQETLRNIKNVDKLQDLFDLPVQSLTNGEIYYVTNLSGSYAIVDGVVYDIITESDGVTDYRYFEVQIVNNSIVVGEAYFNDYVIVSNPFEPNNKRRYDLTDDDINGQNIKVYLIKPDGNETIYLYSDQDSVSTFTVFENGKYMEGDNFTHYFRINDVYSVGELSPLGWEQLKNTDYDFYRINSDEDYFKGNNPHTGHLHYDNGHEYFTYFSNLFKYSSNNSLIDESILIDYPNYANISLHNDIDNFGFSGLIKDDECDLSYDDFLIEDSKIHYFGDWFESRATITTVDDNGTIKRNFFDTVNYYYFNNDIITKNNEIPYNVSDISPKEMTCRNNPNFSYGKIKKEKAKLIDGCTNQIVNNKIVKIIFYLRNDSFYSKSALEEMKYLQSIVVPYMNQVIPSGAILETCYIYNGQKM
jgi:hypothetical protein